MHRIMKGGVAIGLAMGGIALAPSAAHAGTEAIICDNPGVTWWNWASVQQPWVVTHASRYENYTNYAQTLQKSASMVTSVTATAGASSTTAGSFSADYLIGKLEAQTSITISLQVSGSKTSTATQSVTTTLQPHGSTIAYAGTRKASGSWSYNKCTSARALLVSRGTAASWDVLAEGAIFCANNPPSTTLAYRAKQLYC